MKILALLVARGGSKRLPGKNSRFLGGKPLVVWSIDVVKGLPQICDLLVSTDDPEIALICSDAGAWVPWLRPAEFATDTASSVDVALHALDWYEAERGMVDALLLLQPTSPFRTRQTVIKGINLFLQNGARPVLAVHQMHSNPLGALKIEHHFLEPLISEDHFKIRSQALLKAYMPTGGLYLISPATLREKKSFISEKTVPLIIESPKEAIDIDTEWDWFLAQTAISNS